jgi:hypothetical protein
MAKMQAEMETKWMEFATPGDAHKVLDQKVGRWTFTMKYWPLTAESPMQEATGTTETKWIMDGRYIEDKTNSTFDGHPFEGRGITGYDNMTHKYHFTWVDNMGTGFMTGEGTWDPAKKTFEFETMSPNVMTGEYCKSWSVEKFTDKDHWMSEFHGPDVNGREYKMMEIWFTRAH